MSKPELLAPARNFHVGVVALDNGADAVYLGLQKHNARARGENFTLDELARITRYAHELDKKVYVALNTLVKEEELHEIAPCLKEIAEIRPDGIMVQDLGVARILREFFSFLPLHASTQLGVHNSAGVKFLAEQGFHRVILERQMTLEEIQVVAERSPLELEVFAHGALCCSLSGGCLFSSWLGGHSGNRGRCKQPCRRRYFSDEGNGFFFSLKDLQTLSLISQFERIGVTGLKIEGRLQNTQYVVSVLKAYRNVLDTPPSERDNVLNEAKNVLASSLGRKWSQGFYEGTADLVEYKRVLSSGLLCGKLLRAREGGIEIEVSRRIKCGDKVRIQPKSGDEGPVFTISQMRVNGRSVQQARKGEVCFLPGRKEAQPDSFVYITERQFSGDENLPEQFSKATFSVDISVEVSGEGFRITCGAPFENELLQTYDIELPPARKYALTSELIVHEFRKAPPEEVYPFHVYAHVGENLFLNKKRLRQVRQDFYAWLSEKLTAESVETGGARGLRLYNQHIKTTPSLPPANISGQEKVVYDPYGINSKTSETDVLAHPLGHTCASTDEVVLPEFCAENEMDALKCRIQKAVEDGIKRFRITALYQLFLLRKCGVPATRVFSGAFPLPVCNSMAFEELVGYGVDKAMLWIELDKGARESVLRRIPQFRAEMYTKGKPAILTTRAEIPVEVTIADQRGHRFTVEKGNGLVRVYPVKRLALPVPSSGVSIYDEAIHEDQGEEEASSFNYYREWV